VLHNDHYQPVNATEQRIRTTHPRASFAQELQQQATPLDIVNESFNWARSTAYAPFILAGVARQEPPGGPQRDIDPDPPQRQLRPHRRNHRRGPHGPRRLPPRRRAGHRRQLTACGAHRSDIPAHRTRCVCPSMFSSKPIRPSTPTSPCREPLATTVARTFAIAIVVGAILAFRNGGLARWPLATLLVLWPSFGGHWVEVFFLNVLRPRLPPRGRCRSRRGLPSGFVAGIAFSVAMRLTLIAITGVHPARWLPWWIAGCGFIGIELVAHLVLLVRRCPSFYDGRG